MSVEKVQIDKKIIEKKHSNKKLLFIGIITASITVFLLFLITFGTLFIISR